MKIRCICLISLMHMVDSMFSVGQSNKNKRKSLDEVISFLSKRQRLNGTLETSQLKNVLSGYEQGSSKYSEEGIPGGNLDLVIDETPGKCDDVHEIASEVAHKEAIRQRMEELLEDRKSAIETDNNPGSAYHIIENYMESVFGKAGEQVENGKMDLATSLLDWFSDSRNVQKLELKRCDLTCGFLRAFLSIVGFSEIGVSGRYECLVTIRYLEGYKKGDEKTNNSRNSKKTLRGHRGYLRHSMTHVSTVYIKGYKLTALLAKKGLDETKTYTVLTAWLREIKVDRFIYFWQVSHNNKIYSCIIYHNLSKEQKDELIVVNICRITYVDENHKEKLQENSFPFVESKNTNFKIILECYGAIDPTFIDNILGNTSTSKCEIFFMNREYLYNFYGDIKWHGKETNFEYGVKLNNVSVFYKNEQECKDFFKVSSILWNLNTNVGRIDTSTLEHLKSIIETKRLKGLKRFTIVLPPQDSKLESVAAFFEVFGNNKARISEDSRKTFQDTLIKYIEFRTLEELDFLSKKLQQLYITLDTVINSSFEAPMKQLEVHFIYEDATAHEKNVLDISNFAINSDEMALISKMRIDKLNLRNVIFRWNISDKKSLDVMEPYKESRWYGKIYSENARYTITEKEQKEIKDERNKLLHSISSRYYYKRRTLKKRCIAHSFPVSSLDKEESKLALEQNNKSLKIFEMYKTLWEDISEEWIINGLEYFGRKNNLATTRASHMSASDGDDVTISSLLS